MNLIIFKFVYIVGTPQKQIIAKIAGLREIKYVAIDPYDITTF